MIAHEQQLNSMFARGRCPVAFYNDPVVRGDAGGVHGGVEPLGGGADRQCAFACHRQMQWCDALRPTGVPWLCGPPRNHRRDIGEGAVLNGFERGNGRGQGHGAHGVTRGQASGKQDHARRLM